MQLSNLKMPTTLSRNALSARPSGDAAMHLKPRAPSPWPSHCQVVFGCSFSSSRQVVHCCCHCILHTAISWSTSILVGAFSRASKRPSGTDRQHYSVKFPIHCWTPPLSLTDDNILFPSISPRSDRDITATRSTRAYLRVPSPSPRLALINEDDGIV